LRGIALDVLAANGTGVLKFAHACLKRFHISTDAATGFFGDIKSRVFMIEFILHFKKSVSSASLAAL
jgi:hypothetical protein